jgi:hypothetical protein
MYFCVVLCIVVCDCVLPPGDNPTAVNKNNNTLPGISDNNGVLLEVEWDKNCREPKVEKIVPVYHKHMF